MSNGLTTEERKTIAAVFAQVPAIERAVLFGSRAMGLARSNSDVDIALYGEKLRLSDILHAASLLEETLLPYQFDLISHASITSPDLLEHIRQYGKEMYRKESNPQEKCSLGRCTASDFQEYELGCVCARLSSGKGISSKDVISDGAFPVYGGNGLRGYTDKYNFDGECAIIGRQGAFCGNVRYFSGKAYMTEHAVVVCANEENDTRFLAYLLGTMNLGRLSGQSAQPGLSVKTLSKQLVLLPPLAEQKRIAQVLNSLDDKIENNRKINQHLEEMAQAIFKSWFVDFEPFAGGEFIKSELGAIPKGWKIERFSELVTIKYGKSHQKLADGLIPVFGSGGIMRFVDTALYSGESILIPRKGTLDNVIYVNQPFWSVDTMFYTEMKRPNIAKFVYFFLRSKDLAAMNTGSAVPSMTTEILNSLSVVVPPDEDLARYESVVDAQFKKIQDNICENKTLSVFRDALLPRLISGELSVADHDCAK